MKAITPPNQYFEKLQEENKYLQKFAGLVCSECQSAWNIREYKGIILCKTCIDLLPKQGEVISNMIKVNILVIIDGEAIAEVDCVDYDNYRKLPDAIKVEGKILGKSGWSSDRNLACYKESILLGQILDIKG